MKKIVISIVVYACFLQALVFGQEDVNLRKETLAVLSAAIRDSHEPILVDVPDDVRAHIMSIKNPSSINDLSNVNAILWVEKHVLGRYDLRVKNAFDVLSGELKISGDKLHGEDVSSILVHAFFSRLNNEEYDLGGEIINSALYWRENSTPIDRFSPDGRGEIDWVWKLETKARIHGVIHVGIDKIKRRFICYENTVGLYFPEGDVLERIYRDILQDPDRAGIFVGRGRFEKLNRESPESSSDPR